MEDLTNLLLSGYCVTPRAIFDRLHALTFSGAADDAIIRGRAAALKGNWVIFDPFDDGEGWLLVGDDLPALIKETIDAERVAHGVAA